MFRGSVLMAWHTLASDVGRWGKSPAKFDPLARVNSEGTAAIYHAGCTSSERGPGAHQAEQLAAAIVSTIAAGYTWTANDTTVLSIEVLDSA